MNVYHTVFVAKKKAGDMTITLDSPIKTEEDILDVKTAIAKRVNESGTECEPSEVVILNWILLED